MTKQKESHARSLVKGITWRLVGTIDTFVISWFILKEGNSASAIAIWDTSIKFVLYYIHERLWQNIPLGVIRQYRVFRQFAKRIIPTDYHRRVVKKESHIRSVLKGVTWRVLGTSTTILVAYLLIGDTTAALQIGGIEVITKFILYYLHERIWQIVPRGTVRTIVSKDKQSSNSK